MICICAQKVSAFNSQVSAMNAGLPTSVAMPPLLDKLAQQAKAKAAIDMGAAVAPGADLAAKPKVTADMAAQLTADASPEGKLANEIKAAANLKANMDAKLGMNLSSPSCHCMANGLANSLNVSGLLDAMANLAAAAALAPLGALADTLNSLKDNLGIDLLAPNANEKIAATLSAPITATVSPSAKIAPTLSEKATVDAKLAAIADAEAALANAFGANLSSDMGLKAAASGLSSVAANMSALDALASLASLAALGPGMGALAAMEAIENTLGVSPLSAGSGAALSSALGNVSSTLSAAPKVSVAPKASVSMAPSAKLSAAPAAKMSLSASPTAKATLAAKANALGSLSASAKPVGVAGMNVAMLMNALDLLANAGANVIALAPCSSH